MFANLLTPILATWAILAPVTAALLSGDEASTDISRTTKYPIHRVRSTGSDAMPTQIANQQWIYTIEISIGNPPQKTFVQVDTGSSELWVNANCSAAPTQLNQKELCEKVPIYKVNDSTTATGPLGPGKIGYGKGDTLVGVLFDYYKDTISVAGMEVTNQTLGVASNSAQLPIGIMGLGPDLERGFAVNESYPVLLDSLVAQKQIASRIYSVDLGVADDAQGSLIFGGIDKGKYIGSLEKIPIVKSQEGKSRLTVDYSSLKVHGKGQSKVYDVSNHTNVLLDTGYTFSQLNRNISERIFADIGATLDKDLGYYVVDCSVRDVDGGFDFGFGNKTITVPFREFIFTADGICAVGLQPVEDGKQQVLGVSFLRAAYVVFDWDNKNVHLAQLANCTSEIVPVTTGPNAVPSVVGSCQPSTPATSQGSTMGSISFALVATSLLLALA